MKDMPDWIRKVYDYAAAVAPKEFCGQLEVNLFQGAVTNLNVKQSFKK